MNAQEALGPWLKRYWGLEIVMSDSHTVQLSDAQSNGWMPIDTAPREGFVLLLVKTMRGKVLPFCGQWIGFWVILNADEAVQRVEPTHWMPLPPALFASDSSENEATK